jgi:hypothetical protein
MEIFYFALATVPGGAFAEDGEGSNEMEVIE